MRLTTEVVLCTYNGAAFVIEQLRSIILQTIKIDKISIYDDRSSENTFGLIQDYVSTLGWNEQQRFSIEVNPENLGYAANFLTGISKATEDILFLSDQDDIWEKRKVETILELFEHSGADMVFSDGLLIDEFGRRLGSATVLSSYGLKPESLERFQTSAFELLVKRNYVNGAAAAIRRVAGQGALPLPCNMPHDYWLAIWCALHHGVMATPQPLYRYRQHRKNVIGAGSDNLLYEWLGIWRQPHAPRIRELRIWEAVTERISGLDCPQQLVTARNKLEWLRRVAIGEKNLSRAAAIAASAFNGSYSAYSGKDSFLRDVVSLIK